MATELSRDELRRLARLGAQRRLEELRREEAAIRAAFPDLDDGGASRAGRRARPRGGPARAAKATSAAKRSKAKRRWAMSAAQKRAVSERMKKYWAARKKAQE